MNKIKKVVLTPVQKAAVIAECPWWDNEALSLQISDTFCLGKGQVFIIISRILRDNDKIHAIITAGHGKHKRQLTV